MLNSAKVSHIAFKHLVINRIKLYVQVDAETYLSSSEQSVEINVIREGICGY